MTTHKLFTDSCNRSFNVRVVRNGDTYGHKLCLTHDRDEPMVEFYDARYDFDHDENGVVLGQFVSRYYMSSIFEVAAMGRGLILDGGIASWQIEADAVSAIGQWL